MKKPYRRRAEVMENELTLDVKLLAFSAVTFVLSSEKVRAFEVDPAPLKISRGFSNARGARQPRAFERRAAPLNFSGKKGDQVGVLKRAEKSGQGLDGLDAPGFPGKACEREPSATDTRSRL